jgi:hypothetical protein
MQQKFLFAVRNSCSQRSFTNGRLCVLHARSEVADLLGLDPCKTQSQNQTGVLEYVTGSERVMERQ